MDNEQKNDPRDQARNLFFQTALTQAQIAELIGVSQKTISLWMNDGKWKSLKDAAEHTPAVMIEHMTNELSELHYNIASREPGKRFATLQEAEIRRKILVSLKTFGDQQGAGVHIDVLMNFVNYVRRQDVDDVKIIVKHADDYLKGEKKTELPKPFKPYSLPGQFDVPPPAGLPNKTDSTAPPPPPEKDNPENLDKAA